MDLDDETARLLERMERALTAPLSNRKAVAIAMAKAVRTSLQQVYDQGVFVGHSNAADPVIARLTAELDEARKERDEAIAARWDGMALSIEHTGGSHVRQ